MTPPAGPEEVREPDFEAAMTWAHNTIAERTGAWDLRRNAARAYVALQARTPSLEELFKWCEEQRRVAYERDIGGLVLVIEHLRTVLTGAEPNPYWYCNPCRTLHPRGTECRLAKLEQERGRGEG